LINTPGDTNLKFLTDIMGFPYNKVRQLIVQSLIK